MGARLAWATTIACVLAVAQAGCADDRAPPPIGGGADAGRDGGDEDGASAPDLGEVDAGADAGAIGDADVGPPAPPPAAAPVCGNGVLEPGESCDDAGDEPGDGCGPDCRWEAFCGDGTIDGALGEVCDDGVRVSGDGCRSDCASDERCGNGIIDTAAGELCDGPDTALCAGGCRVMPTCGDATIDAPAGETCDDGNVERWDGCGPDCRDEVAFVVTSLEIAGSMEGCDESGDGAPDHALARGLGATRGLFNMLVGNELRFGTSVQMLLALGLDDASAQEDEDFRLALLRGYDADGDASDHGSGSAELWAPRSVLDADGRVNGSMRASVRGGELASGPEDTALALPLGAVVFRATVAATRLRATVDASGGRATGVREAMMCGALSLASLATMEVNPLSLVPGAGELRGCDDDEQPTRFIDSVVGGTLVVGMRAPGAQPDVDIDGDGLELYVVDREGRDGCSPAIVACVDGDGTMIAGRDCVTDPRMGDGLSSAVRLEAVSARVVALR